MDRSARKLLKQKHEKNGRIKYPKPKRNARSRTRVDRYLYLLGAHDIKHDIDIIHYIFHIFRRSIEVLSIRDASMTSVLHRLNILVKRTLSDLERRCHPRLATLLQLLGRYMQFDAVAHSIDRDGVAVLDEGDGASYLGLRDDVPNAEAVRSIYMRVSSIQR